MGMGWQSFVYTGFLNITALVPLPCDICKHPIELYSLQPTLEYFDIITFWEQILELDAEATGARASSSVC